MGTIGAILNVLSGGVDIIKGWMGMQKTATDQKAGADAVRADSGDKTIKEVRDAKDVTAAVDAASDAELSKLRNKWTKD